ncbi:unnamed protein product [Bursaphelenchus okinawaensis]|uniref:ELYS-bb domain-containing protein n=1 Tax=Bursaphelenchus okinawaensis TaxID=465554 RepID=A0A811L9E0_9BILA|nr:unnamed protein product [Bursaphelenchus okinawaensis]CAG9120364.1 unnamed protein product [Bursaphelenchus okinawaensis]
MRRAGFNGPISAVVQELRESEFKDDSFNFEEKSVLGGGMFDKKSTKQDYFYIYNDNHLMVYQKGGAASQSLVVLNYYFNDTAAVQSAVYFRADESMEGVLVAVRDLALDANYVSFISFETKKQHKACLFNAKISHVQVCVDGVSMKTATGLSAGLGKYPHVLVVGGEDTYAAIFHMGLIPKEPCEDNAKLPNKCIMLMKPDENGDIEYNTELKQGTFKKEAVEVTSLCYVEERRVVAVGLSNGIVSLSSLKSGLVGYVYIGRSFEVLDITWQNSIDDSDKCIFMWMYIRRIYDNQHILCLFSNSGAVGNSEISWVRRFHYIIKDCQEMLVMKSIPLNKEQAAAIGLTDNTEVEDTMNTTVSSPEWYTANMMFMYVESINGTRTLRGSVFDLDAYYTKRMPGEPVPDRTPARQCGFLSFFKAPEGISFKPSDVLDVNVVDISRFKRPASVEEHVDQLFYPSSLNFTVDILTTTKITQMEVLCIQDQAINQIEKNIVEYFEDPSHASSFLFSLGLTNSLPDENDVVMRSCVFRILLNNNFLGLLRVVTDPNLPRDILVFIDKWLFKELEACKARLESENTMMISEPLRNVPKATFEYLTHSQSVFRRSAKVFTELAKRFEELNMGESALTRVKAHAKVAADFVLVASGYIFGLHNDLLRQTEENVEIMNKLKLEFAKRSNMARHLNSKLEIHQIFEEILDANQDELEEALGIEVASELYPPECYLNFMAVLPLFNISEAAKLSVIGYLAKDLDLVDVHSDWNYFDRACSYFLNDNLSSDKMKQMSDVWSSDYKLLTIGKLAESSEMHALKVVSEEEETVEEKDLCFMPCETEEEKIKLLELYSQLPHGIHKYNKDMISRKRYEMIVEPPVQVEEDEPEFVKETRLNILKIKKDFPFAFAKNSFPPEILEKCRKNRNAVPKMVLTNSGGPQVIEMSTNKGLSGRILHQNDDLDMLIDEAKVPQKFPTDEMDEKKENMNAFTPPSKHSYLLPQITPPSCRKTPMASTPVMVRTATGATPVRDREGVMLTSALRAKDMERIKRMTTPLSVRKRVSVFSSTTVTKYRKTTFEGGSTPTAPSSSTPPFSKRTREIKPTSILRTAGSVRRTAISESKIQFTKTKKIHHIPTNAENRRVQNADTSFTEFSKLDDSTASEMSQNSLLGDEIDLHQSIDFEENSPNSEDDGEDLFSITRTIETAQEYVTERFFSPKKDEAKDEKADEATEEETPGTPEAADEEACGTTEASDEQAFGTIDATDEQGSGTAEASEAQETLETTYEVDKKMDTSASSEEPERIPATVEVVDEMSDAEEPEVLSTTYDVDNDVQEEDSVANSEGASVQNDEKTTAEVVEEPERPSETPEKTIAEDETTVLDSEQTFVKHDETATKDTVQHDDLQLATDEQEPSASEPPKKRRGRKPKDPNESSSSGRKTTPRPKAAALSRRSPRLQTPEPSAVNDTDDSFKPRRSPRLNRQK